MQPLGNPVGDDDNDPKFTTIPISSPQATSFYVNGHASTNSPTSTTKAYGSTATSYEQRAQSDHHSNGTASYASVPASQHVSIADNPPRDTAGPPAPVDIQAKDGPATTLKDANSGAQIEVNQPRHNNDQPRHNDAASQADSGIMRAEPTRYGQAYSERHPAANIQTHRENEARRQEASKQYLAGVQAQSADGENANVPVAKDPTGHENPSDGDNARAGATEDVPIGAEKSNVLFQPTPDVKFDRVFETLEKDSLQIAYMVFGAILILDWVFIGGGFRGFLKSLFPASGIAGSVFFILSGVGKKAADRSMDQSEPETEKLRYVPESVEWMNTLMDTLWQTLQQSFFDDIAKQIDDTIRPLIPQGVPVTVKITDLGHGKQSARVLSMRSLPDSEFGDLVPQHGTDRSGSAEQAKQREKRVEEEEGGVFYNLEIAVAYHAAPMLSRKQHMHVDVLAMIGPVPLPVFVEVKEFVATIRIRLQMHPDLPFLKNVTFALTESPKVNTCVSIGAPWALNLLNLPVIDNLVQSQIDQAAAAYVQPKSMSMDMTVYVGGSDQKDETEAVGVLFVKIHGARDLARQDSKGPGADPYLTIAFSKYEKPMYATRIIKGDLNPVWEESAIVMIRPEHVKRKENVLLRLWDSDTMGSDDVSGHCEFPLLDLILKPNKMHKRKDPLQGDVAGTNAQGLLKWEIGYFPRAEFSKTLRTDASNPRDHRGEKKEVAESDQEATAHNTVPNPETPSGILGITIHQCINVKVDNPNKKSMGHVQVQQQDSDGEDDGEQETISIDYIPSLYVTADINDQLVYRTRVKSINSAPTFNSSTEQYVRDWRLASLTLSVWDTRKKEDDCLVGVVSLKMSDIFHESSSVVKFYELKGGEGTGRIRVSMIFRSMRMQLEKSLLGYSVGTFVFTSPITVTGDVHTNKLKLRASGSKRPVKGSGSKSEHGYTWTLAKEDALLPVHYRYLSPIVLEFVSGGLSEKISGPLGKDKHYAVLWLFKIVDNQTTSFTLPVYKTDNANRFIQNVVTESDSTMNLEKVGEVKFTAKFKAGIDESHGDFLVDRDQWSTFESWKAARKSGQRADQVSRRSNATVDRLRASSSASSASGSQAIPV